MAFQNTYLPTTSPKLASKFFHDIKTILGAKNLKRTAHRTRENGRMERYEPTIQTLND